MALSVMHIYWNEGLIEANMEVPTVDLAAGIESFPYENLPNV
jgi:hypothetical protein